MLKFRIIQVSSISPQWTIYPIQPYQKGSYTCNNYFESYGSNTLNTLNAKIALILVSLFAYLTDITVTPKEKILLCFKARNSNPGTV